MLELYDNKKLIGTIPHSMGQMSHLQYLKFHHTKLNLYNWKELQIEHMDLSGAVPDGVCHLRAPLASLQFFGADCGSHHAMIQCAWPCCCTNCYDHNL